MMLRKFLILAAYGIPTICILAVLAFNIFQPIQVIPRIGIGPGFGLTDINQKRVTNETMRGKVVLYNFTYTNCGDPCNGLMDKLKTVWHELEQVERGDIPVELVTIAIDPERDSPEALRAYMTEFGITPEGSSIPWHVLHGDDPETVRIMVSSGFDFYYEKVATENEVYDFNFVPMVVLIDGWGIIRSEYRQYEVDELRFSESKTDIDPDIILRDIGLVLNEIANSRGVNSAAYEAAHLFSCYPP